MPSFGGYEILVVMLAALIILGPTKLPELARTLGLWFGRIRRTFNNFKLEFEREVGMDEIRQQLHNEKIMAEMKALENDANSILNETDSAIQAASSTGSDETDDVLRATKSNSAG
ncbi:MAG: twin-arginine translocase subunit TatB [Gammaproteobacteria bacterium]|nr:twin-arginine translocase subunit TatB [Gammaproteobacteria bacterium]